MTVEQQISLEEEISQLETEIFLMENEEFPDNRLINKLKKQLEDLNERLTSG